jgi:hypothetical protein
MMPYVYSDWDALKSCCVNNDSTPLAYCDFVKYVDLDSAGNAYAKNSTDPVAQRCGQLVEQLGFDRVWYTL